MPTATRWIAATALFATVVVTGCRISSHGKNGKEDVSIDTPIGGLSVKTDPAAVLQRIGLPAYPGAVPAQQKSSDKDSADVNLSFGSFHLRVQAAGFQTGDNTSQVQAFYRKALAQYSDVIACHNEQAVGQPSSTGMGLTCHNDKHVHTQLKQDKDANGPELTLKAGSPTHQHLVALQPQNGGTHFSLVALDLPKGDDDK